MVTVSFLVEFLYKESTIQHIHDICVYEYLKAPGFNKIAESKIKQTVDMLYGPKAYGYTHFVISYTHPLGKFKMSN